MKHTQQGVGLLEVLVSLILLSIAVLGFVALQMNAIAATHEASRNVQAMNIARDLSERIRANRDGLADYKKATTVKECNKVLCDAAEMAAYDFKQVTDKADSLGKQVNILDCQGPSALKRKCIYVAWEGTTATNGTKSTDCTNGVAYMPEARCIIVEVYNYDD